MGPELAPMEDEHHTGIFLLLPDRVDNRVMEETLRVQLSPVHFILTDRGL